MFTARVACEPGGRKAPQREKVHLRHPTLFTFTPPHTQWEGVSAMVHFVGVVRGHERGIRSDAISRRSPGTEGVNQRPNDEREAVLERDQVAPHLGQEEGARRTSTCPRCSAQACQAAKNVRPDSSWSLLPRR
eukprot:2282073-Prymnesium_polylepis.1